MDMTLTAVYEQVSKSEGDGYVAYVEELPGAISEGDTLEEARENLRDAVALLLEANRDLAGQRISGKKITRKRSPSPSLSGPRKSRGSPLSPPHNNSSTHRSGRGHKRADHIRWNHESRGFNRKES